MKTKLIDPIKLGQRLLWHWRNGQALVEMAICLPLVVLMAVITLDYGRMYFHFQSVESAAAAGAQFGCQNLVQAANTIGIRSNALAQAVDIAGLSPRVTNSVINGTNISVTVSAVFTPSVQFPPLPTNIVLRRTVIMRILQ